MSEPSETVPGVPPADGVSQLPALVGPFDVLEELEGTPYSVIYAGRKTQADEVVAVERLRARDEIESGRFRVATSLEMRLDHVHILRVSSVGEDDGRPYAVTAKVDAEPLAMRLEREGPFSPNEAAALVLKLALAVAYAHQRGVLHGGISPRVVFLRSDGEPLLARFGRQGATIGEAFRAPEQDSGAELVEATDVYGLGVVLHALITGSPPARPQSASDRRRPSDSDVGAPSPLDAICSACLTLRPEDRYATPRALADDLERFLGGQSLGPRPDKRSRSSAGLTMGLAAIVGLALLGLWRLASAPQGSGPARVPVASARPLLPGPRHLDVTEETVAVVGDELTLRWAPVDGDAVRYEVELDGELVGTVDDPEWRGTLSSSGTHSWRVRAVRGERPTAWSTPMAVLALDRLQPLGPPEDARISEGARLTLEWSEGPGDLYELELDETLEPMWVTTYTVSDLELGRHSWRVRSLTSSVTGPWSRRRWFEVVPWEGVAPTLQEPVDGGVAVIGAGTPIRWAEVPGATGYEIEWDSEHPWAAIVRVSTNHSQAYSTSPGAHSWRVRALRGEAQGAWSENLTLNMSRAPPGGVLLEIEELTVLREGAWKLLGKQPLSAAASQIWCRFERRGDWIAVVVPVDRPGTYRAEVFYTCAQSGGRAQLRIGGLGVEVEIDGYAPKFEGNKSKSLGSVELPFHTWEGVTLSGDTRQVSGAVLAIQIVGKDERSSGYCLGIDSITLVPLDTHDPPDPIPAGDPEAVPATLPLLLLEAEQLPILAMGKSGYLTTQDLSVLGSGWSQGQHLCFDPHRVGQWFAAVVPLTTGNRYEVEAFFTRAPSYGRVRLTLGGASLEIDGYAPKATPSGPVALGEVSLRPRAGWVGTARPIDPDADRSPRTLDGVPLTIQSLGEAEGGSGLACGLDALLLVPLDPPPQHSALPLANPDQVASVLQLPPPPEEAPPAEIPAATLRLLTPCPAEVVVGDTVSLEFELLNAGAEAGWGGLTVGFPLLEKLTEGAEIRWESGLEVIAYSRGAEVWSESGGIRARYPFLEAASAPWAGGVRHTLKLAIRPTRAGDFVLDVRAALVLKELIVRAPAESELLDQQEWPITRYTIAVRER